MTATTYIGQSRCSRCGGTSPQGCPVCHDEEPERLTATALNDLRIHVRYLTAAAHRKHAREVKIIKALGGSCVKYKLEIAEAALKRDLKALAPKQRELERAEAQNQ